MEFPYNVLIISAALIALSVIAWLELRYIKGRRVDADSTVEQDHVYNSLATYKAVSDSLRAQGRDTTEADILLFQAESAYRHGQYLDCKELSGRAKTALRNAPQKEAPSPPSQPKEIIRESEPAEVQADPPSSPRTAPSEAAAPAEVPSLKAKKMPCNYLESKFVIETTKSMLDEAPEQQREAARSMLDDADACFEEADYTDALRHAVKAKKLLEGCEEAAPAVKECGAPPSEDMIACAICGAAMSGDDAFCFACGTPAARTCPHCSAALIEGDVFCRRCGARL